jgi:hypothetical protein
MIPWYAPASFAAWVFAVLVVKGIFRKMPLSGDRPDRDPADN